MGHGPAVDRDSADRSGRYGCGEGEQPGGDAGVDAVQGAPAVVFEGELAFEGVDDGLDPLPVAGQLAEPGWFVLAVGADRVGVEFVADEGFEVSAGEALVAEDDLSGVDEVTRRVPAAPGRLLVRRSWGWPVAR